MLFCTCGIFDIFVCDGTHSRVFVLSRVCNEYNLIVFMLLLLVCCVNSGYNGAFLGSVNDSGYPVFLYYIN